MRVLCGMLAGLILVSGMAEARTWDFEGEISDCNALACGLIGIGPGERISGYLTADDAASQPGSTFGPADIIDYGIAAQGVAVGPGDSTIESALVTTDGAAELSGGSIVFSGTFDGGVFGLIELTVVVDISFATWSVSTDALGIGEVASGPGDWLLEPDGDDVASIADNCTMVANALQTDTDLDGFGNACDADFDNDCFVTFPDLAVMEAAFFTSDPLADLDGSGFVTFPDLAVMESQFFLPPGPSGVPNICAP